MKFLLIGSITLVACTPAMPDAVEFPEAAVLAQEVDQERLMATVRRMAADHLADKKVSCEGYPPKEEVPTCQLSNEAAIAMVWDAFTTMGYQPTRLAQGDAPLAVNVVAERRGETRPEQVVLVGAHLDAYFSGADDNTSAVAAMLEIARLAAGRRFSRTVRFVAFDLEEFGSVGSTRYVKAGLASDVRLALILECLGYTSTKQDGLPGLSLGETGDFLLAVANGDSIDQAQSILALNHTHGFLPMKGLAAGGSAWFPLTSTLTRSDNGPFWLEGIPALMLTDTANLRNPHYHEPEDTPETLNPMFLAAATRISLASVALFAELLP